MIKFSIFLSLCLVIIYKAICSTSFVNKRLLIVELIKKGYTQIKVSAPIYDDLDHLFPERPLTFLNTGRTPLIAVHIYTVQCRDTNGESLKLVARVQARYIRKPEIIIKSLQSFPRQ